MIYTCIHREKERDIDGRIYIHKLYFALYWTRLVLAQCLSTDILVREEESMLQYFKKEALASSIPQCQIYIMRCLCLTISRVVLSLCLEVIVLYAAL